MLLRVAAKEGKTMAFEELKYKQSVMWGNRPYRSNGEIHHDREWLFVYGTRR